jgi:hypothetical protein
MYSEKLQDAINDAPKKQAFTDLVGESFANTTYDHGDDTYTQWELECAFDTVSDNIHWKNPIDANIPAIDADIVSYSVSHMAGCLAVVTHMGEAARVEAVGYYAAIDS